MRTHVMLVNGDLELLRNCHMALVDQGYHVSVFSEPLSALTQLDRVASVDVLVTRARFPAGQPNGIALANMTLRRKPSAKVIFMASPDMKPFTEDLGEFLPMPAAPADLVAAVRDVTVPQAGLS